MWEKSNIDYLRDYAVLDGERLESLWKEIERLRYDVSHWREARQSALEAGNMLKEENERLRAKIDPLRKRCLNYRRVLRQLNAAHRVLWGIVTVQAMKSIKPTGHSKLLDAAINKANEAAKVPLA